jgi:hypothetical protein
MSRFTYLDGKETDTALIVLLFVNIQTPPPAFETFLSVLKTQYELSLIINLSGTDEFNQVSVIQTTSGLAICNK